MSNSARQPAEGGEKPRGGNAVRRLLIGLAAVLVLAAAAAIAIFSGGGSTLPADAAEKTPSFVGSEACAGCHQAEADLWRASQHRHAMDHATDATVRGDFNDARYEHFGVKSRFFREGGKFLVETDGPDGKLAVFEVKYTFGVEPLQQYLIAFPDGRLQALSIAWDTRAKEEGGQRWFHLYPNEAIPHDDVLHWTKLNQNWNFMCAECHSTGLRKNYDAEQDRFATTWAEISVGCEACHGQGSAHLAWAKEKQSWWPLGKTDDPTMGLLVAYAERIGISWTPDPATGNARRSSVPATLRKEVETCGRCHARRAQQSEDWVPGRWLSETHAVTTLNRGLYHADGQMQGEVFNYGSFKQSKMFAAGVTCSDCHDPHSGKLRLAGDATCLQCHAPDKYAALSHHRHASASPPPACASCHMPARTYMVVDTRHDHSFRVPRPDLSVRLGTPNACNDCHRDKTADWAAAAVESWHGPARKGFQTYAPAFTAAWEDLPDAGRLLAAVVTDGKAPAIARATALAELAPHASAETIALARGAAGSLDPTVRIGALDMLGNVPVAQAWPIAAPLLGDPVHGVRIRAASLLAGVPADRLAAADRERFERAAAEFVAAQRLAADRPEARSALASFLLRRGQAAEAETELKVALRLNPQFAPAAINLADLYRQTAREGEAEAVLRSALAASPAEAGLHHALGLSLVRAKRLDDAVAELRSAAELEPGNARYLYVYAVALNSAGRRPDAIAALVENLQRHPRDRDTLMALASFHREAGEMQAALRYAEELSAMLPGDRNLGSLVEDLRRQTSRTPQPQ